MMGLGTNPNDPVEALETTSPMMIDWYGYRPDTGGGGYGHPFDRAPAAGPAGPTRAASGTGR